MIGITDLPAAPAARRSAVRAIVFVPGAGGWSYRAAFPLPVLQRAARAFVDWFPLRRARCLGRSPAVQLLAKQQNLMGEHGTWSIGRARTCAVDDRVRDVCYGNRPVVAGGASSDDERGRGRAGQRQWPLDRPAVSFSLRRHIHGQ